MRLYPDRKIILEGGEEYYGFSFGAGGDRVLELVFNTSMTGYQEIMSDPSYTDQAVVMTYPLIGNYGIADDDYESCGASAGAFIVREYNDEPSNFRSVETLGSVMKRKNISGLYGVDTRKLTRSIRNIGSRKVLITSADTPADKGIELLDKYILPKDVVARSSCKKRYSIGEKGSFNIAVIDCGVKKSILGSLLKRGMRLNVMPWNASYEDIRSVDPDGVLLSNGPGDPENIPETVETVKKLIGNYPIFGICLGHQIISLAYGAKTYKLKFGHRGGNHPVKEMDTGRIAMTSQNHSFAVDMDSLKQTPLTVTHINLLDGTVEGTRCPEDKVMSVQFHPESAPGPEDSGYLFDTFIKMMGER